MNLQARIKQIKDTNSKAIIEKAKAEERLKHLESQKAEIEKQCAELGVNPLELDQHIEKERQAAEKAIAEAEALLGLNNATEEESPF